MADASGSATPRTDRKKAVEPAQHDRAAVVQVSIAEFNKLRDEIGARSGSAWTLLGLNATVSSTVAGFVLAQKANPLALLLLPLLAPSLGLLFIDHATNIGNIGTYINTVLKPLLREAADDERLLSYEEWVDNFERQPVRRLLPFGIPLVLLFNAVPIGSLVFSASRLDDLWWAWVLWTIGLAATAIQFAFWVALLGPPLRRAMRTPNS
jgi:hypothetical protein